MMGNAILRKMSSLNTFEPLTTYETYNVTWAEHNVDNSYKKGSRNRNCMAKPLTFFSRFVNSYRTSCTATSIPC